MLQTPLFIKLYEALRKALIAFGLFLLFVVGLEMVRAVNLLRRIDPLVAVGFGVFLGLVAFWFVIKYVSRSTDRRIFMPPPAPADGAVSHAELRDYCKYLVIFLKRLSGNTNLSAEVQTQARQQAYNIDEVLGAHPLKDDLLRAIEKTMAGFLSPVLHQLHAQADAYTLERTRAVVDDVIEPPFPVIAPFVILYIQVTLISRIADIYYSRLGLLAYWTILRDVARIVTRGQFFKLGQNLFAGVYSNSPPLGRSIIDVGQSLTSIWLTHAVSRATILRCETLGEADIEDFIEQLEGQVVGMLADTKECFVRDAMATLRLRIRHSAPPGTADVAAFSDAIAEGVAKAVDSVVKGYQSQPPAQAIAAARKTYAGTPPAPGPEPEPESSVRRRRRKKSTQHGVFRVFHTFGQRIKYTVSPGHEKK